MNKRPHGRRVGLLVDIDPTAYFMARKLSDATDNSSFITMRCE